MKHKLDTFVNFPIQNLNLSKYLNPAVVGPNTDSYTYELYAVINHYGGLGGGHYSAYAKVHVKHTVLAFTWFTAP
jgi:ubiquitin C-terminal hydrolase